MTKNNFKPIAITAILAVAMISLSAYSYVAYAAPQVDPTVKTNLWGQVSNDNIVGEERVIKVTGARDKLEKTTDAEFAKNGLPVNLLFTDPVDSTLVVGIKAGSPLPLAVYKEKLQSLVGSVPMKVNFVDATFNSCTSQTSDCTPIIGGIQTGTFNGVNIGYEHTLTLGATDTSNRHGFIINGHSPVGVTGFDAYQAYPLVNPRHVGKVITASQPDPFDGKRKSDSAFVQCDNFLGICTPVGVDETKIYRGNNLWYNVLSVKRDPVYQDSVSVMGLKSQLKSGHIVGTNLSYQVQFSPTSPLYWYKGQALADYVLQPGDSGSPVFTTPPVNSNDVTFLGIHSSFICIGAIGTDGPSCISHGGSPASMLSPWSSIKSDLSLN